MKMPSTKRLQIGKANTMILIVVSVAAFVTTFSLVSARALWVKRGFQNRVIEAKEQAADQLKDNIAAVDGLVTAYKEFTARPENVLKGDPNGTGELDGNNAKIILDALPSKYDFPALTTSLEKLLTDDKFTINSITGTDDEIAQSSSEGTVSSPIDIPFQLSASTAPKSLQSLLQLFERSIRPIKIQTILIKSDGTIINVDVVATTSYLPEKLLTITKKEVK